MVPARSIPHSIVKDLPLTVYVVWLDAGHEIVLAVVPAALEGAAALLAHTFDGGPKSLACTF